MALARILPIIVFLVFGLFPAAEADQCFWFYNQRPSLFLSGWDDIFRMITISPRPENQATINDFIKKIDSRLQNSEGSWPTSSKEIFESEIYKKFVQADADFKVKILDHHPHFKTWIDWQIRRNQQSNTIGIKNHDEVVAHQKFLGWLELDKWITDKAIQDRNRLFWKNGSADVLGNADLSFLLEINKRVIEETGSSRLSITKSSLFTFLSAGKIRTSNVSAANIEKKRQDVYIDHKSVPGAIEQAFRWLRQDSKNLHPLVRVMTFYQLMISIHPFADGNGRSIRFYCDYLLFQLGYPPLAEGYPVAQFINSMGNIVWQSELLEDRTEHYFHNVRRGIGSRF
jgi:hypothetical protein